MKNFRFRNGWGFLGWLEWIGIWYWNSKNLEQTKCDFGMRSIELHKIIVLYWNGKRKYGLDWSIRKALELDWLGLKWSRIFGMDWKWFELFWTGILTGYFVTSEDLKVKFLSETRFKFWSFRPFRLDQKAWRIWISKFWMVRSSSFFGYGRRRLSHWESSLALAYIWKSRFRIHGSE